MDSSGAQILQNIVATLRSTEEFALVTLGKTDSATSVPRAHVLYEGQEILTADDTYSARWMRLKVGILIHSRAKNGPAGVVRATELSTLALEALLEDRFRAANCCDLPVGEATELSGIEFPTCIRRPEIETILKLRCHFEISGVQ